MPFGEANGIRLYYELDGRGPRLLFISGTGGDLRTGPKVTDGPIVQSFEVLAYDQRGLGQSDVPPGPYAMADYADDAAALLDVMGWDRCLVIGASFGGMVAQELTLRHPGRVTRLVLACTSAGGAGGSSYPLQNLAGLEPDERAVRQMEILDTRWDAAWQAAHADAVQMMTERFRLAQTPTGGPGPDGPTLQLEARSRHDTAARLGQIDCPTLVCGGRFDGTAPPANSEFLARAIPGADLAMFDGGHLFLVQDRAALPAIVTFLSAAPDR
jgi:3-oxoadipate enol-lactonase